MRDPVDWKKPIEAYHEDGRVWTARKTCWLNGDVWGVVIDGFNGNGHTDALPNGYVGYGWRIRNVA